MPVPKWKLIKKNDSCEVLDLRLSDFTVSITHLSGGKTTQGHSHPGEEVYIFPEKGITMVLGNKEKLSGLGTTLYIPSGVFHQARNNSMGQISFICIFKRREAIEKGGE